MTILKNILLVGAGSFVGGAQEISKILNFIVYRIFYTFAL